jgi:deoxyribodipyrimidine photo-lyase
MIQNSLFPTDAPALAKINWESTRAAGLGRLAAFLPSAGQAYTRSRNIDFGPHDRSNVSALSPWLSRRLITEHEVVTAVISAHGFHRAEKFIQEVFWRTYWKGWLEMRPDVLTSFNQARLELQQSASTNTVLGSRLAIAMNGETGIACFDAWVGELRNLGWLHNHARMWFASIWIFTLELPWQLGADFFYKHLLDADAASNTLSWRWVAGLQTKGKHYLARASNIAANSANRFDPAGQLNESAMPLMETDQVVSPMELPRSNPPLTNRVGLLLTQDDLNPESLPLSSHVVGAAGLVFAPIGTPDSPRNRFSYGAMSDCKERTRQKFGCPVCDVTSANDVVVWAKTLGVTQIVTGYAPTGLVAWQLNDISKSLAQENIELVQIVRDWDLRAWPHARGGFFKLKEKLPMLIRELSGA